MFQRHLVTLIISSGNVSFYVISAKFRQRRIMAVCWEMLTNRYDEDFREMCYCYLLNLLRKLDTTDDLTYQAESETLQM